MKILMIGDVVGSNGSSFLRKKLSALKKENGIDFVIANGENSADGNGITLSSANFLFDSGVDIITTGNHAFRRKEIYSLFDEDKNLIRPANFPEGAAPGNGFCIIDTLKTKILIINLLGTIFMESLPCPFKTIDNILEKYGESAIVIVDFHAETTSEKRAMGFYLDGRVSAVLGTHTHVATADECILPKGTGYVTDVGMTGPINSVLGVKPEIIIKKLTTKMPVRFDFASGDCKMDCILLEVDEKTKKAIAIERLKVNN
ncbi:MAG: 2',3'-cyclic-nucleotide 2'-phosphodiesterase [Eubacteriales bacterium SKADARSKE-1]|nr:2',3'-cyclic-nucleotide 2'-phosphodiesterase [Eubacteriales bacterium SKADARSKE-1]